MSCEGHRKKYFLELEAENSEINADHLDRLYQAGRNQGISPAQVQLMEAKTRKLFADMQHRGIKPPTHSPTGLPRKRSQVGYAAVLDYLERYGGLDGKNGDNEHKSQEAKEKGKKCGPALNFVGLGDDDTQELVEKFPVWKHLPRCARCGCWMATQSPVCRNPRCGMQGMRQSQYPVKWPPEGADFKRSKVTPLSDMLALNQLPKAEIAIATSEGIRDVTLEYISDDGMIHFSEIVNGGVPIKGRGFTRKENVVLWPGQTPKTPTIAKPKSYVNVESNANVKPQAKPELPKRPNWATRGMAVHRVDGSSDHLMYIADLEYTSMLLSDRPGGEIVAVTRYGLYESAEQYSVEEESSAPTITLPDGYNGETESFYAEPVEVDGNQVRLRCATSGKQYMTRWMDVDEHRQATAGLKCPKCGEFTGEEHTCPESEDTQAVELPALPDIHQYRQAMYDVYQKGYQGALDAGILAPDSNHTGAMVLTGLIKAEAEKRFAEGQTDIAELFSDEWGENALNQVSPFFTQESDSHKKLLQYLREKSAEQEESLGIFGRCGYCGAFTDREGNCNNPNCPSDGVSDVAEIPLVDVQDEAPADETPTVPAFDWKSVNPGDILSDGSRLIKRRIRNKAAAEKLANQAGGIVMIDGPNTWAVATQEADKYGFVAGLGDSHDLVPDWMSVPKLGETDGQENPDFVIKLFTPDSSFTHYVMEYDGDDTCFGLVEGFDTELGYFSLSELESVRGPLGLRVERELWTKPKPVSETPEYKAKWGTGGPYKAETENEPAVENDATDGSTAQRCEHCGAFVDNDGNCNNPRCPGPPAFVFENDENTDSFYVQLSDDGGYKSVLVKRYTDFSDTDLEEDFRDGSAITFEVKVPPELDDVSAINLAGYRLYQEWQTVDAAALGRCRHCGAFVGEDGHCNNPNCPGENSNDEPASTITIEPEPEMDHDPIEPETSVPQAQTFTRMADSEIVAGGAIAAGGEIAPDAQRISIRRIHVQHGHRSDEPYYIDDPDERPEPFEFVAVDDAGTVLGRAETAADLRDALDDLLDGPHTDIGLSGDNFSEPERTAFTAVFGRCGNCGAFTDREGNCNNPNCPGEKEDSGDAIPQPVEVDLSVMEGAFDLEESETEYFAQSTGHDYVISDADELGKGGAKQKARDNIAAIRLLSELEESGREATPEEQAILVKYVGWGALPQVFDWKNQHYDRGYNRGEKPPFYDEWKELKDLLDEEEFRSASRSTINAHYTSSTVVRGIWDAIKAMGYDRSDGKILEPAAGIGHFFGMMPEEFRNATKVGVELDATTAAIAKHLYQNADIRHSGFEDTALPDDYFDLAISNVPFGDYGVFDPHFNTNPKRKRMAKSIHNYFFAKSLDKVKPGGVVAFITSRYTMDGTDPAVRQYLAEQADLVGAMRLPNTAFKENAGTEVTTDVIFLRKRLPGEAPSDTSWVETREVKGKNGESIHVNEYFANRPEMMLGKLSTAGSMYGRREVTLESDGRDLGEAIQEAITRLPKDALVAPHGRCSNCGAFLDRNGSCNNPNCSSKRPKTNKRYLTERGQEEGQYILRDDGVYRVEGGQLVPHEKSDQQTKSGDDAMEIRRIRGMLPVNEAAREVLRLNVEEADSAKLAGAQANLNQVYDDFVTEFGPLNSQANQRALSGDPNLPFLMALEDNFDREENKADKGAIFAQRVIAIQKTVTQSDTPVDALRVTLNESGTLDWARMSELTGQNIATLQKVLLKEGVVFRTPDGEWQTAEAYLSGNVREKLRQAEAAAAIDPVFQPNVIALQDVLPRDLEPDEIKAALGSPWISTNDIASFAKHLFGGAEFKVINIGALAEWKVQSTKTRGWGRDVFNKQSAENLQVWGTPQANALSLLEDALNGKEAVVMTTLVDEEGNERRVIDQEATIAARERQAKIKEEFEKWIFESDPERTKRLVTLYNERYNSEVPRQYDGSHITLPGLAANMPELRGHQKDAVWRISQGENALLAHVVGAGKTFAMIGGGMELRRMGIRKKPMHVIPNHMLEQYTADIYRMYPAANVLAISSEALTPKKRAETMSRIATGDWDAVVVTHSALTKLPVKAETESKFISEEIQELREALEMARMDDDSKLTVKRLEKKLAQTEARLKATIAKIGEKQDSTITWEELGVDQLFVDEADEFKNLTFATRRTNLPGISNSGSQKADALYVKIRAMKDLYGKNQSVVFATGTPIANSICEMYNMQRFLDHDNLAEKGLAHFDAWASQFGETVTSIEMKPSGGGYQTKTRFAQFNNVPELKRMFMRFADIRIDPNELKLPRPKLKADEDGVRRQRGVAVPASDDLKGYIASLVERAENLDPRDRKSDNMLKITSEGRMAALDMRLVDPIAEDHPGSKLNKAVENIFDIYQRTTGVKRAGDERQHNMAQLVFCDLGTPAAAKEGRFSVYHDVERKLVARGVKAEEIAFMQDYGSDEQKAELFQQVNDGKVRVLIGSTQTMGAGTNVQKRLAALHHLDAPWRPRDIEQREGRILRPGNLNEEVEIHRYLTEESFDVYNWQLLERKAKFISQVMNRDLTERSAEDIDQEALTYAEMKALATGNPALIEKVAVDAELRKLTALEGAYRQRTFKLRQKTENLPKEIEAKQTEIARTRASLAALERAEAGATEREEQVKAEVEKARAWARETADRAKAEDTPENRGVAENARNAARSLADRFQSEKGFGMSLRSRNWDTRQEAGSILAQIESEIIRDPKPGKQPEEIGEYLGFPLLVQHPNVPGGEAKFYLKLTDEEAQLIAPNKDSGRTFDPLKDSDNITRIRRSLGAPAKRLEQAEQQLASLQTELETVQGTGGVFEHQERFDFLKQRVKQLDAELGEIA